MASSSSDESSKAPENFHVSSSNEECISPNNGTTSTGRRNISLKCPLCLTLQKRFHCRNCIQNGRFFHSTHRLPESFTEKQHKFLNLQAGLNVFSKRYERLIKEKKFFEDLNFEIKFKKEKISLLNQLIAVKKSKLLQLCTDRDEVKSSNNDKRKNLPKYQIKVKELEDYVLDRIEKINKMRDQNKFLLDKLKDTTRRDVQNLVDYIFPISEVVLKDEIRDRLTATAAAKAALTGVVSEYSDTIAALADAKNTSYIRGKWVFHGSGISEMQYRIVAPSLPANGDYSAYLDWLTENKDDVPKTTANEITPSRVSAFRITGALTYTTQLANLMSYYLNVRLPYKLAYGDFCKKLNDEQFLRKVSRLNTNILYLAYTQRVKLRSLNANHTLENILATLDIEKSDLGRHGHHEITNAPLMKSVDSLLIGIETATESESEDDDNSLRLDWEAVSSLSNNEIEQSDLMPSSSQQTSIANGLMTSAANRLTSILRWIK